MEKTIVYPFQRKLSYRIFALSCLVVSLMSLIVGILFFVYGKGNRVGNVVLGIFFCVFFLLSLLEGIHLLLFRVSSVEDRIVVRSVFGKEKIDLDSRCMCHIGESSSTTSDLISVRLKKDGDSVSFSYPVGDYTPEDCLSFYQEVFLLLKKHQVRMEVSPFLASLFKVVSKKYFTEDSTEGLFLDFVPDEKKEVRQKRRKKLFSLCILTAILLLMGVFLLLLTALKPVVNEGYSYSTNDIIFLILYSLLILFVLVYMVHQIRKLLSKEDSELK